MIKSLTWQVKESFVAYVQKFGTVTVDHPASEDAEGFVFPLEEAEPELLKFKGRMEFYAHGGLLSASVANPWLHVTSTGSYLTIEGTARTQTEGSRLRVAEIAALVSPEAVLGTHSAVLADVGTALFDYRYGAGEPLAFVLIT